MPAGERAGNCCGPRNSSKQHQMTPKNKPFVNSAIHELEKKLSSATAKLSCQQQPDSSYQQSSQSSSSFSAQHNHLHQGPIQHSPALLHPQQGRYYAPPQQQQQQRQHPDHFYATTASVVVSPVPNESSSLQAILQVIRAEKQQELNQHQHHVHQQHQHGEKRVRHREQQRAVAKHCDLYIATATTNERTSTASPVADQTRPVPHHHPHQQQQHHRSSSPSQTLPPLSQPKFSAVNFRRVQRHPPVSYPKRPLVTQRSLGSPPSVNVGSSYSPSASGSTGGAGGATSSNNYAVPGAGLFERHRRAPHRRHESAFLKTRSKTISDFFGPESTPVSRLLNIICQEKEAERVAHIMNQQQQQQQHYHTRSAAVNGVASGGASSHGSTRETRSASGSGSSSRTLVATATSNSGSDSGSGSAPVLVDPSFAAKDIDRIVKYKADRRKPIYLRNNVHENENERLEPSKRVRTSSSGPATSRQPDANESVSPVHRKTAVTTVQPKAIRTTRSSRLRAAATHATETKPTTKPAVVTGNDESLRSTTLAARTSPKHSTTGPIRKALASVGLRSGKLLSSVTRRETGAVPVVNKALLPTAVPAKSSVAASGGTSSGGENGGKRLVPSIAVNMKQRLKTTTETIKGAVATERSSALQTKRTTAKKEPIGSGSAVGSGVPASNDTNGPEDDEPVSKPTAPVPISKLRRLTFFENPPQPNDTAADGNDRSTQEPPPSLGTLRSRTSTLKLSHSGRPEVAALPKDVNGLSPVTGSATGTPKPALKGATLESPSKDKSAKRKSFLNRSQTEESANGGARSANATATTPPTEQRYQRRPKLPLGSPDILSSSNRSSPVKSSSSVGDKSPTISPKPAMSPAKLSSPDTITNRHFAASSTGTSPVRICSRLSSCGSTTNSSPAFAQSRSPPLAYHMEQARRELLVTSPPRLKRPVVAPVRNASVSPPIVTVGTSVDSNQNGAKAPLVNEEQPMADAAPSPDVEQVVPAIGVEGEVREEDLVLQERVASPAVLVAEEEEEIDEISEEQSSSIGQYSKFSQILKSPTLESNSLCRLMGDLALEDEESFRGEEVVNGEPEVEIVEEEQKPAARPLSVPSDTGLEAEAKSSRESLTPETEQMEAGPSGLCSASSSSVTFVAADDEDEDDDDEYDNDDGHSGMVATQFATGGAGPREYIAVVDESMPAPSNRILYDDQFNDEFMVIENSPKSQLIHSLDEADIIVLRDHDADYADAPPSRPSSSGSYREGSKKLLKMSSVEHFERKSLSPQRSKQSVSPIFRAKSMDEGSGGNLASSSSSAATGTAAGTSANHIVSILKRKTVESTVSSASNNASPVTFSPSVVDTPIRSNRKQGILKKRCSLDESRYSRSHSPDDRSILVRHTRRNSFEDGSAGSSSSNSTVATQQQQHGILKQNRSYESREDVSGGGSAGSASRNSTVGGTASSGSGSAGSGALCVSHGILKKKNDSSSTSTPSEQPKHVSIAQAVIMAAAEICQDMLMDDEEGDGLGGGYDIKPILKSDHQAPLAPKPILKKKYSSESEEIRPILKSSRKSSREENSDSEEMKRSILKIDSPRRRCYVDQQGGPAGDLMVCSMGSSTSSDSAPSAGQLSLNRSLELPDSVSAPVVPQVTNIEKPIISVAERIMNMEKFLSGANSSSSGGAGPSSSRHGVSALSRRESFRYKTQPVTTSELNSVQQRHQQQQQQQEQAQQESQNVSCQLVEPIAAAASSDGVQSESQCGEAHVERAVCDDALDPAREPHDADCAVASANPGTIGVSSVKFVTGGEQETDQGAAVQENHSEEPSPSVEPEPAKEPQRTLAPEHSCLRSSLELLIQRSHSADRAAPADREEPKPSSSSFELLSPTTLGTAESNSHSIISGEFNLASLSSDSGVQLGRPSSRGGTDELSTTDFVSPVKTSDSEKSPSKKTLDGDVDDDLLVVVDVLGEVEEDAQLLEIQEQQQQQQQHSENHGRRRSAGGTLLLSPTSSLCSSLGRCQPRPSSSNSSSASSTGGDGRIVAGAEPATLGVASGVVVRRKLPGSSASSDNSGSSSDLSDRESGPRSIGCDDDGTMFGGCVGFGRNGSSCGGGGSGSGDDGTDKGFLRRSNSVRERASMFAQLESKLKEKENPMLGRPNVPRPRRAPQFNTQTVSPTDVERSNNAINSGLTSYAQRNSLIPPASTTIMNPSTTTTTTNSNIISDDSGTEFDPSTLKVSKKVKLFSGGCLIVAGDDESGHTKRLTLLGESKENGAMDLTPTTVRRKKPLQKTRCGGVGKVVLPKFLNDSNNNNNNNSNGEPTQHQNGHCSEREQTELNQIARPKVDTIRRKFMSVQSTPKAIENGTSHSTCPASGCDRDGDDASGSDSNVDSGKENNYDSGVENTNGSPSNRPPLGQQQQPQQQQDSGTVMALKRNFLNGTAKPKSPHPKDGAVLDISSELDGLVVKGKVSRMANQWNRVRMKLDVSSILKTSGTTFETPPSPARNESAKVQQQQQQQHRLEDPSYPESPGNSTLDGTLSQTINNTSAFSRSYSRRSGGGAKFALIENRFAKYFGMAAGQQSDSTEPKSMESSLKRNESVRENRSSSYCFKPMTPRPRSQSMPKESLLLQKQKLDSMIIAIAASNYGLEPMADRWRTGHTKLVDTVDELNITTEDLSTADTDFDKLFVASPRKPPAAYLPPNAQKLPFMAELKGGILKSKSGCVGLFPADLNSELKSRLKKSTHSAVSNLKKSTTVSSIDGVGSLLYPSHPHAANNGSSSESEDDEDGVAPGKNLAKMLRNVSNTANSSAAPPPSYIPLPIASGASPFHRSTAAAATATQSTQGGEGDSAIPGGGFSRDSISKNPAVARRRRQNEG
uniref:HP domain-containing protein n=1 Tax=Anopheles albimanus TaxID=7167 RepID=A0A182FGL3_ANOAL